MESDAMSMSSRPGRLPRQSSIWRNVLWAVGLGLLCLAMLYVKVAYNSGESFRSGEEAYASGEFKTALTQYERAIKWYTPWSPLVRRAVERLWQLGTEAEARGDAALALEAYQTLRSSLYAVQSVYIPHQAWIPKGEERIAPLLAARKNVADTSDPEKLAQDTTRFAKQLQRHVGPHRGWSLLAEISFLSWVGATLGLIWYVVDNEGNFVPRQGFLWGSMLTLFFALWLLGMRFA